MTCELFPWLRSMVPGAFSCTFAAMLSTLFSFCASFFSSASTAAGVSKVLVSSSGMVVAAKMLGKIKTVTQIICIVVMLVEPVLDRVIVYFAPGYPLAGVCPLSWAFVGVMTLFTLLSGIDYLKNGLKHISTDK